MTTDKTPVTLATAKHGGCMQLGDGRTINKIARELLADQIYGNAKHVFTVIGDDEIAVTCGDAVRAIKAALSAQPSPVDMVNPISPSTAGQGDAVEHAKNLDLARAGSPLVASRVAALLGSKQTSSPSGIKLFHCEINVSPVVPPEITPPGCVWGTLTTCFKCNAESL
jgi:hypothetical protein